MTLIKREDAIEAVRESCGGTAHSLTDILSNMTVYEKAKAKLQALPSAEAEKKKAELKENGDWDCPDVYCDECDHHRSVEWCSLAIPNHEEIDDTYKMVTEAFFEGFESAEKRYRLLIEILEEHEEKSAESEWIPCSERLPKEEEETYWVCTDTEYQCECRWTNNRFGLGEGEWGWSIFDTPQYSKPIAWMPLPKPYREEREVEE